MCASVLGQAPDRGIQCFVCILGLYKVPHNSDSPKKTKSFQNHLIIRHSHFLKSLRQSEGLKHPRSLCEYPMKRQAVTIQPHSTSRPAAKRQQTTKKVLSWSRVGGKQTRSSTLHTHQSKRPTPNHRAFPIGTGDNRRQEQEQGTTATPPKKKKKWMQEKRTLQCTKEEQKTAKGHTR